MKKLNYTIRKAKLTDVDEITELNIELMQYHKKYDSYYIIVKNARALVKKHTKLKIKSRNALVLVAEVDGKIIGYLKAEIKKHNPIYTNNVIGNLGDEFVITKYRRYGIGKELTKEFLKWLKLKKVKEVIVTVDSRNKISINAWKKFGFKDFQLKLKQKVK